MSEDSKPFVPTISALKNDGVAVKVFKITRVNEVDDETGEPVTTWHRTDEKRDLTLRFTNLVMSDLELEFGTMDNWQKAITERPYNVVLSTICTVTGKTRAQVSEMLDSSSNEEYQVALLLAWMMAMGADASQLGKMLGSASKLGQAKEQLINQMTAQADNVDEALANTFPGLNLPEDGAAPEEVSLPSGDIPQPKPSSFSEATTHQKPKKASSSK